MRRALLFMALASACPAAALAGDVIVTADQARKIEGGVIFRLYDEAGYLKQPIEEIYSKLNADGSAVVTFKGVKPGSYAVVAIHDKNGNRKMDTNFLGIPKEKGGFSNNAPASFGPAKFSKAAFTVNATGNVKLTIHMNQ